MSNIQFYLIKVFLILILGSTALLTGCATEPRVVSFQDSNTIQILNGFAPQPKGFLVIENKSIRLDEPLPIEGKRI